LCGGPVLGVVVQNYRLRVDVFLAELGCVQ
jgi:hypothetical protein